MSINLPTYLYLLGQIHYPIHVAIQLLRPASGHVYFVHTAETRVIADRLCAATGLKAGKETTKIPVTDASANEIISKVYQHATGKTELGLHYTGGTKRMALYTQQAILKAADQYGYLPTWSYLDARTLSLYIEKAGGNTHILPAAFAVQPSTATLLALHGCTASSTLGTPIADYLTGLYPALVQTPYEVFRQWWDKAKHGMRGRMEQIVLPHGSLLAPLADYWNGVETVGDLASQWQTTVGELARWFDNLGLEDYTLWSLQQKQQVTAVHETAMNLKAKELGFEFDVIALRGYQLFAISCANADKKDQLKLKLFEAFVRARQMGGDEARVAVVCRAPAHDSQRTPAVIEQEIRNEWDREGKIRVFGEEHLPNLADHLADWLTTQP
ncbi:MAG: hypothetical protein R3E79_02810 [Caldilineaceae bacterium]